MILLMIQTAWSSQMLCRLDSTYAKSFYADCSFRAHRLHNEGLYPALDMARIISSSR